LYDGKPDHWEMQYPTYLFDFVKKMHYQNGTRVYVFRKQIILDILSKTLEMIDEATTKEGAILFYGD
jgi:hypothetical protein